MQFDKNFTSEENVSIMRSGGFLLILVEDSKADAELVETIVSPLVSSFQCCTNGQEALDFLYRKNSYANLDDQEMKTIMLIDLNMPKVNGIELLQTLNKDSQYKKIPKIILSTSQSELDIEKSFESGASGFITKPLHFSELETKLNICLNFWLEVSNVPKVKIYARSN